LGLYLVVLELLEFFYIVLKSFCKNILRCENFTLLTSAVAHNGFSTYRRVSPRGTHCNRRTTAWSGPATAMTPQCHRRTTAWSGPATAVGHGGCVRHTAVTHGG
jgi:hypothetical protein